MTTRTPAGAARPFGWAVGLLTLATLAIPPGVRAQGPWRPGGRAGAVVRLESAPARGGLDLRAFATRSQTPRVEITGSAGMLWFPRGETVLRFRSPEDTQVTQVRSEEIGGPYVAMAAGRRMSDGDTELHLEAAVELGLLRERVTITSDRPDIVRPFDLVDWEVSPAWAVGGMVRLPAWSALGLRPEVRARLRVLTLVSDGFVPTASLTIGAIRAGG